MIISRTPYRVSLFGGGTDYSKWFNKKSGLVLSTTIDKYCYISCRLLPPFFEHNHRIVYSKNEIVKKIADIKHPSVKAVLEYKKINHGIEIHHFGDLPARSGIGSSSSFTVGLLNVINSLNYMKTSCKKLAQEAIHIEQNIIKENVGSQDQIAASFGGINLIKFHKNSDFTVNKISIPLKNIKKLENNFMLFYTGRKRNSSIPAGKIIENIKIKTKYLSEMQKMPALAKNILLSNNFDDYEFGNLLDYAWQSKKELSNSVSNKFIDDIYSSAINAGAIGGKLLGAGSAGFMLFYVPKNKQKKVLSILHKLTFVPFKFEFEGSKIVINQPKGFI